MSQLVHVWGQGQVLTVVKLDLTWFSLPLSLTLDTAKALGSNPCPCSSQTRLLPALCALRHPWRILHSCLQQRRGARCHLHCVWSQQWLPRFNCDDPLSIVSGCMHIHGCVCSLFIPFVLWIVCIRMCFLYNFIFACLRVYKLACMCVHVCLCVYMLCVCVCICCHSYSGVTDSK